VCVCVCVCVCVQQNQETRQQLSSHVLKLPSHQRAGVPKPVQQLLEKPVKAKKKRQSSTEIENQTTPQATPTVTQT
jgi:hypothetical protein